MLSWLDDIKGLLGRTLQSELKNSWKMDVTHWRWGSINSCAAVITSWFIRVGCGWLTLPALGIVNEQRRRWCSRTWPHPFLNVTGAGWVFPPGDTVFLVFFYNQSLIIHRTSSWRRTTARRDLEMFIEGNHIEFAISIIIGRSDKDKRANLTFIFSLRYQIIVIT